MKPKTNKNYSDTSISGGKKTNTFLILQYM